MGKVRSKMTKILGAPQSNTNPNMFESCDSRFCPKALSNPKVHKLSIQ